jgi:hypothetical protein
LTGIFAISGTQTSYILEKNRDADDPGRIEDPRAFANFLLERYFALASMYFGMGGQNMFVPALWYQRFYERGSDYTELVARLSLDLISESATRFYRDNEIDPYFVGIDTLLHLANDGPASRLGKELSDFCAGWQYASQRRKLLWEIATIPLFSVWRVDQDKALRDALAAELSNLSNLADLQPALYKIYSQAIYGIDLPMPHFYLGTNRNGDLKLRSSLPIGLGYSGSFRMFFVPYPSLNMKEESLRAILEDLAFGSADLRSHDIDYAAVYTRELADAEYKRVLDLSANVESVLGLFRHVENQGD